MAPTWVACRMTRPAAVGVTVKTPLTGVLIVAEPLTTVSTIGKAELAVGLTVNEPSMTARSGMAAKLIDCQVGLTAPVV